MKSDQDVTPDGKLFDLMGNVQEWTVDLWREDKAGIDEAWADDGSQTYRAIRGFPLSAALRPRLQADGAAYREPLCATGACVAKTREKLRYVGFRCARPVADDPHASRTTTAPTPAPQVVGAPAARAPTAPSAAPAPVIATAVVSPDPAPEAAPAPAAPAVDPTPPQATPTTPAPVQVNSLTPPMIAAAINKIRPSILKCGAGLEGAGKVRVGVKVDGDGSILNVEIRETPDEWLGRCVATRIQAAHLPVTASGGTFVYTFDF